MITLQTVYVSKMGNIYLVSGVTTAPSDKAQRTPKLDEMGGMPSKSYIKAPLLRSKTVNWNRNIYEYMYNSHQDPIVLKSQPFHLNRMLVCIMLPVNYKSEIQTVLTRSRLINDFTLPVESRMSMRAI